MEELLVRSSEYFRAQARLYRDLAHLISDPEASSHAMGTAAEYLEKAQEMEQAERASEQATGS
jgi:hypothetical protein